MPETLDAPQTEEINAADSPVSGPQTDGNELDDGTGDDGNYEVEIKREATPIPVQQPEPTTNDTPAVVPIPSEPTQIAPSITADLMQDALDRGYTEEDIKEMGSAAAVRRAVFAFDKNMSRLGRQATQNYRGMALPPPVSIPSNAAASTPQAQAPQHSPQSQTAPQQTAQTTVAPQVAPQPVQFQLPLNEEDVDPAIAKPIKALSDFVVSKIEALENEAAYWRQQDASRNFNTLQDKFDAAITSLPDEYQRLLGKGTRHDLDETSESFQLRNAVMDEFLNAQLPAYVQLHGADFARGGPRKADKLIRDLVRRAANATLADRLFQQASQTVVEKLASRQSEMSVPPSASAARRRMSPEQRAREAVAAAMGTQTREEYTEEELGVD